MVECRVNTSRKQPSALYRLHPHLAVATSMPEHCHKLQGKGTAYDMGNTGPLNTVMHFVCSLTQKLHMCKF